MNFQAIKQGKIYSFEQSKAIYPDSTFIWNTSIVECNTSTNYLVLNKGISDCYLNYLHVLTSTGLVGFITVFPYEPMETLTP